MTWRVKKVPTLTPMLVVHVETSRSFGWFYDETEANVVVDALNAHEQKKTTSEVRVNITRKEPTYQAVCWTCGLENDSPEALEWGRKHSADGRYGASDRWGMKERHAVRVTVTQDIIFNKELG